MLVIRTGPRHVLSATFSRRTPAGSFIRRLQQVTYGENQSACTSVILKGSRQCGLFPAQPCRYLRAYLTIPLTSTMLSCFPIVLPVLRVNVLLVLLPVLGLSRPSFVTKHRSSLIHSNHAVHCRPLHKFGGVHRASFLCCPIDDSDLAILDSRNVAFYHTAQPAPPFVFRTCTVWKAQTRTLPALVQPLLLTRRHLSELNPPLHVHSGSVLSTSSKSNISATLHHPHPES